MKIAAIISLATSTTMSLAGCTIYTNTDRDNFNAKAVPQQAASAACMIKTEESPKTSTASGEESASASSDSAITIRCGTPPNDKTIVRVSR